MSGLGCLCRVGQGRQFALSDYTCSAEVVFFRSTVSHRDLDKGATERSVQTSPNRGNRLARSERNLVSFMTAPHRCKISRLDCSRPDGRMVRESLESSVEEVWMEVRLTGMEKSPRLLDFHPYRPSPFSLTPHATSTKHQALQLSSFRL